MADSANMSQPRTKQKLKQRRIEETESTNRSWRQKHKKGLYGEAEFSENDTAHTALVCRKKR